MSTPFPSVAPAASLVGSAVLLSLLALAGAAILAGDDRRKSPQLGARYGQGAAWLAFGSALLGAAAVLGQGPITHRFVTLGPGLGLGVYLDTVACTMLVLVAFLGALVMRYADHYLEGDARKGYFVRWLCLTQLAVLTLVVADNLALFAMAWIATSLCLHQLLVFYAERPAAQLAARKKFIISRLAEVCLVVAIALIYHGFGTLDFAAMHAPRQAATVLPRAEVGLIASLLVVSALLKSAQFPFHGWLAEVMETPTPVSALLHAGIVNAGGYLLIRTSPIVQLYQPALDAVALVGAATAIIASLVMLTQTSVKVSLAWSTCAQMGFMLLQCGLSAYATALLHIVAHSVYKAYAFLSAGSAVARAETAAATASQPRTLRLLFMLLGAAALAAVASAALGLDPRVRLGEWVLGVMLALSLAFLLHQSSVRRGGTAVLLGGLALAAASSISYLALHAAAGAVVGAAVPPPEAPTDFGYALASTLVILFTLMLLGQAALPQRLRQPRWQAAYVHLLNGLYVNVLTNRLMRALWPEPVDSPPRASRTPAHADEPAEAPLGEAQLVALIRTAARRIAPVWPLRNFVAVNPFLGFTAQPFAQVASTMQRVAALRTVMPQSFYGSQLASGQIDASDLELAALQLRTQGVDAGADLVAAAGHPAGLTDSLPPPVATTVASALQQATGVPWSREVVIEIGKWCAAYYDCGQASWRMPWQPLPLYAAWRAAVQLDRSPACLGLGQFATDVAQLPTEPRAAICAVMQQLGLGPAASADYLHRALLDVKGWAAYARYRVWERELLAGRQEPADEVEQLLAIRLSWDSALHQHARRDRRLPPRLGEPWERYFGRASSAMAQAAAASPIRPELTAELVLQQASEHAYQRKLLGPLLERAEDAAQTTAAPLRSPRRPPLQAVFCIDVREELLRRALETVAPDIETLGMAGFFGFPIEYIPLGAPSGSKQCPVLLTPQFRVCEVLPEQRPGEQAALVRQRSGRGKIWAAWSAFKQSAGSCFAYVETGGLLFAPKLLRASFGWTRSAERPGSEAVSPKLRRRLAPSIARAEQAAAGTAEPVSPLPAPPPAWRASGFTLPERTALAEAVLRSMSLTENFARLILLVGHCSTSVNNPHAAGLDCGACGGGSGEPNARVAAAVLNDAAVRAALAMRGLLIPADTWFIAALHNTTTDQVTVFAPDELPSSHRDELAVGQRWLNEGCARVRRERAPQLGIGVTSAAATDAAIAQRSRDWSQVRPEWGLAGNSAFIAAPRSRTRGMHLGGRVFLHSYDYRSDAEFKVLELILTAPLVVASWINLQYYGATVNPEAFGSGNKVLHNVVGTLGVLQGSAGDLQVGLPLQSVHDGERFRHAPLRLTAVIEAPKHAVTAILTKHPAVRELFDNGWLHFILLGEQGCTAWRYAGHLQWQALEYQGIELRPPPAGVRWAS